MKSNYIFFFLSILSFTSFSQTEGTMGKAYYFQIPDCPESFTAGTVAARVVDGLGFRYYHATADLTEENLSFKPSEEARTMGETIDHIYGLTITTLNAVMKRPTDYTVKQPELTYQEKRQKTLENIRRTSEILKVSSDKDLESYQIVFISSRGRSEYPFWNQLNGPIADALWHVGQVVTFRRSAGNPFNSKVSVLRGRLKDN